MFASGKLQGGVLVVVLLLTLGLFDHFAQHGARSITGAAVSAGTGASFFNPRPCFAFNNHIKTFKTKRTINH